MSGTDTEWCEGENAIEWLDIDNEVTVTLHGGKLKNRVLKLAEEYPDEVTIKVDPEKNHGYLVAHLPRKWIKINPPRQYTDEQKLAIAERGEAWRASCRDA